ncbi:MAG: ATP-binding protein [Planctomycetaceae bacterium]
MSLANLLVIQGVDQGTRFELDTTEVGIGRGVRNAVRILDTEVSRTHATLEFADGVYTLTDKGSSNGTFVNGVPIRSQRLNNGDQIQCGRTVLLFTTPESDEESKYVAANVDLHGDQTGSDHSRIVGAVGHDPSETLLGGSGQATPQDLMHAVANLQALYRIAEEAVSPSISSEQLLKRILDLTIEVVGADRGCILVSDPNSGDIVPQVYSVRNGGEATSKMPVSRSIVDYVLRESQGVRTSDARHDQRFTPGQSILQAGIREAMCVPMQGRYELMGVVYVDTTTSPERVILDASNRDTFSEDQLRLLVAIGRQTALAIENNRYQQALVQAERLAAMGQTIAMLSHHIKNILQGVRGGSYLIDMGLSNHDEEVVRKGWAIVEKNQGKIYHLVMDMLTFSKERQPVLEVADLNETVGDVCELMQGRAEECDVDLQCHFAENLPQSTFDVEGIHRAVLNIVTNAIDATEGRENSRVLVETGFDEQANSFFVRVSDNGPGIPPEQEATIFNIFESTKGHGGTGLGLAVSQKIIREHGGEITLKNMPDQGCQFQLSWPRIEDEQRFAENHTQV